MKKAGKIILFLGLAIWLTGCSQATDNINFLDLSSRSTVNNTSQLQTENLSSCNAFTGGGFSGKIKLFVQNGIADSDTMRLRLSTVPNDMEGSEHYIQFFRWLADNQGSFLNPEAVEFYIEDSYSHTPISGLMTDLSMTRLSTLGQEVYGTSDTQFLLGQVNIVVTDIGQEWDALKLAHYENDSLVSESNFLAPAFAANPNTYAQDHAPVLLQMHPNYASIGQNIDDRTYLGMTQGLCF